MTALAIIGRDVRLAVRGGTESAMVIVFFVLAAILFPFGVGPEPDVLRRIGPGVIWVVALLAANAVYLVGIKALKWVTGENYGDYFYLWMILLHLVLGFLLIVPLLVFGTLHLLAARNRRNRRAVKIGYVLFSVAIVVLVTGMLLTRVSGYFDLKQPVVRLIVYWLHVISPLAAAWLYPPFSKPG